MVFQTRQLTGSAGSDLVHPARHGLPPNTETVGGGGGGGLGAGMVDAAGPGQGATTSRSPMTALMVVLQGFSVLYLHGVSSSRAYCHRLGLYRLLLGGSQPQPR